MQQARRVVVITGASGGLGREIARRFARGGDRVFAAYHRGEDRARALAEELQSAGHWVVPLALDLTSPASVEKAFDQVEAEAGPAEVLVNNAAYRPIGSFLSLTDGDWQSVIDVCLLGPVRASRRALPAMVARGAGRIINIGGLDALWGWGNRAHVTVSKAGLAGLTRAIAVEFSSRGITANTIVPGSFRTPRDPASYPEWDKMLAYLVERTPVGRQGEPSELAELCWFLASPAASFITGQEIHINGGAFPLLRNPLLESPGQT